MACRRLEINVISAKDLKKVNLIGKMRPYAVVSISGGDPRASQPQWTAVDRSGNASPTWNYPLKFAVEESATRSNRLGVTFRIRCERTLGDKDIGEVHVPLSELNGPTEDGELVQSVTYQSIELRTHSSLFSGRKCSKAIGKAQPRRAEFLLQVGGENGQRASCGSKHVSGASSGTSNGLRVRSTSVGFRIPSATAALWIPARPTTTE
ncbi:hypothetical protein RHGRI_003268 [Rhododendron griersonianum]|uniref:C2 domain-containing protein n=1 Tax=Rhododendron griersonianum TaxID=479676 RepID=A0AAV6L4D6_9ERIC|nr:hypothetical protein RHGRI_003268 [Rhododendron griersonianum]